MIIEILSRNSSKCTKQVRYVIFKLLNEPTWKTLGGVMDVKVGQELKIKR